MNQAKFQPIIMLEDNSCILPVRAIAAVQTTPISTPNSIIAIPKFISLISFLAVKIGFAKPVKVPLQLTAPLPLDTYLV